MLDLQDLADVVVLQEGTHSLRHTANDDVLQEEVIHPVVDGLGDGDFLEGFFFQSWRTVSILRLSMLHFFKRLSKRIQHFSAYFIIYGYLFS